MFTTWCVDARLAQPQPFNWLPADDVGFDDLVHIGECYTAVPHPVRINDNVGAMFALVKASGLIGSNPTL